MFLRNIVGPFWLSILCYTIFTDDYSLHDKYYEMPKLYELDDYHQCMEDGDALFCSLKLQVYSEEDHNAVWTIIQEVNNDTRNFRHDMLQRGVCMSKRYKLTAEEYLRMIQGGERSAFQAALDSYVKEDLTMKYGLTGNASIDLCEHHRQITGKSVAQWLYAAALSLFIILAIAGCFLNTDSHSDGDFTHKVLSAFSVKSNFARLWRQCDAGSNAPGGRNYMHGIQGLRTVVMLLVIFVHIFFFISNSYVDNLEIVEMVFTSNISKLAVNGPSILQLFLCISGFLLSYHFLCWAHEKQHIGYRVYVKLIVQRWLRFTPVSLFTIGYICLWSGEMNMNPSLMRMSTLESEACSHHWWNNLLYINNRNIETFKCMPQTWYLAVDTQLHAIMLLLLIVIWKAKAWAPYVLGGSLVFSLSYVTYVLYVNNYTPFIILSPETLHNVFEGHTVFMGMYIRAYSNSISYLVGMLGGYVLYLVDHNMITLNTKKLEKASKAMFYVLPCVIFSGYLVLADANTNQFYFDKFTIAIYGALFKLILSGSVAIFLLAVGCKTDYYLKEFFESRVMLLLGSLTFSVLNVHLAVETYLMLTYKTFHIGFYSVTEYTVLSIVLSYAVALFTYLIVEMPFYNIQKMIFRQKKHKDSKKK